MILLSPLCHPALNTRHMAVCPQATLQTTCYPYPNLAKAQVPQPGSRAVTPVADPWSLHSYPLVY